METYAADGILDFSAIVCHSDLVNVRHFSEMAKVVFPEHKLVLTVRFNVRNLLKKVKCVLGEALAKTK